MFKSSKVSPIFAFLLLLYCCYAHLKIYEIQENYEIRHATQKNKIAIIIPFTESQTDMLTSNIIDHWHKNTPCLAINNIYQKDPIDLIFYFNKDLTSSTETSIHSTIQFKLKRAFKQTSNNNQFSLSKCFTNIKFISAKLTDEEDLYPLGPTRMFFKLFQNQLRSNLKTIAKYSHFYLMEPDNLPCRSGWATRILSETKGRRQVWMLGSIIRDGNEDNVLASYRKHINGNALYSLSDGFTRLVNKIEDLFWLDSRLYLDSYDIALQMVRDDSEIFSFAEYARSAHFFQYTDLVQNWYRTVINATELCNKELDTWLVHGRNVYL